MENANITWLVGIIGTLVPFVWTVYQYVDSKKREQNLKEFEQFHKLIKELVQPGDQNTLMYIDRQAAIIYELRHFNRYYEFSLRTLEGLRKKWPENEYPRLIEELDLGVEFFKKQLK